MAQLRARSRSVSRGGVNRLPPLPGRDRRAESAGPSERPLPVKVRAQVCLRQCRSSLQTPAHEAECNTWKLQLMHEQQWGCGSRKAASRRKQRAWQEQAESLMRFGGALGLEEAVQVATPDQDGACGGAPAQEDDELGGTKRLLYGNTQVGAAARFSQQPTSCNARLPWSGGVFGSALHSAGSQRLHGWDEVQAAAYVAARMPGCFAATYKVLEEVSMRLPGFRPASLLDFGAGPGTAIWAAREVGAPAASQLPPVMEGGAACCRCVSMHVMCSFVQLCACRM